MLNVILLCAIMLCVVTLNVVAPTYAQLYHYDKALTT
jgi:hypothetical protein